MSRIVKLGDLCDFINGGAWTEKEYVATGIPVLKVSNFKPSGFLLEDVSNLPYRSLEKYKKHLLQKGDMIIATVGSHPNLVNSAAGRSCVITDEVTGYLLNQNAVCVRTLDSDVLDQRYLVYLGKSFYFQHYIQSRGRGAANQMRIAIGAIKEYEFDLPDIETQQRIADILTTYDDLIENNQKQIKLLEEAAMRLYKEWFVNLRFPGYETTKIVDDVPEGWESAVFKDLCELVKDSCKSKDIIGGIPYIGLEHIPRRSICLNEWGDSSDVGSSKYRYKVKDILFGKIRPYFHKVGFAVNEGICSTDAMVFRAYDNMFGLLLTTAFSDEFVAYSYATCREGAKMPRADWNEMGNYSVLIPNEDVLSAYNNIINPLVDSITVLVKQVHNLVDARDKLHSKLMNGKIEV
ncbi:restriction endonuclease subunit S [Sporosarcina sp. 179-K 3D1 HS]|uniref:restriction endonuclease subunit S n=1 Tax=Sporosarcina sp. 179-K 3D1 HS TaxID=3232169 RepID=UPI0039A3B472